MRNLLLYLLISIVMTACANNDLIFQRQSTMEGRLEQVMQAQNSTKAEVASHASQISELKELMAKQLTAANELQLANNDLREKMAALAKRLEPMEPATKKPATIEVVNQDNSTQGREVSVQAAYMKAFGLFSANNYKDAAESFNRFIASYPESEYATNARYWLGECYYSEGLYKEAIETFTKLLEMKPSQQRASEAMLKIGQCWYSLDDAAKGKAALLDVIEKYPGSEAAKKARKQLDRKQ